MNSPPAPGLIAFQNARLVDPAAGYDGPGALLVAEGLIARVSHGRDLTDLPADVRVVDAASGKDITRLILTQIIVEDAKAVDSTFPLDLLREMIVSSGRASQETALRYMKTMLNLYQDAYRAMPPPVNPFEFFRPGGAGPVSSNPAAPPPSPIGEQQGANKEGVDELKRRVAGLEKLVSSLSAKTSAPRKPGRPAKKKKRASL